MKTIKNTLVQYQGGDYDGCIWEWNFFLFDSKGKFHNLFSSGRKGIKTKKEAIHLLSIGERRHLSTDGLYIYDLTKKKAKEEFSSETNPSLVNIIGDKINRIYGKYLMTWVCDVCKSENNCVGYDDNEWEAFESDHQTHHDSYRGDGGIGIVYEDKICDDCYSLNLCSYCGEYYDPETYPNELDDEDGYCTQCSKERKKG